MDETLKVAMICTKVPLRQRGSDFAYWQQQPIAARIAALEEIRREYHRWRYGAEPRFQRILTIAQR